MDFVTNRYLSWYIPRISGAKAAVDLHSSGVRPLSLTQLHLPTTDPWEMISRFEGRLGEWLGLGADEVVFTPGATGGSLLALLTLAEPGAPVVVEAPFYEPMVRQAHRTNPVRRLRRRFGHRWRFDLDEAQRLIDDSTDLVMITEPSNPGGTASPRADVLELARIAAARDAVLLVNEVYRLFGSLPSYHGLADNIVVVSSLSKLFGTYLVRLGWLSASAAVAARLRAAHRNMGLPTAPAAGLGVAIMQQADQLLEVARGAATKGVGDVDRWVRQAQLQWHRPDGPGFGAIRLPRGIDDVALAERLLQLEGILTVPGTFFEAPGTLRISWLRTRDESLREALRKVEAVLAGFPD